MSTRSRIARFPAEPGSIAAARQFAAETVAPVHPELCDAVRLLVSELATNVIRHARSEYEVGVEALPTMVRVAVSDVGEGWPTTGDAAPTDPGGRGLRIVDAVADAWGVIPSGAAPGKSVWFELRAAGEPHR